MPRLREFYRKHPDILVHIRSRIGQFDLELAGLDAVIRLGELPTRCDGEPFVPRLGALGSP